ncbi:FAD-dependent oxidoreductase [Tissierella sp. Yu-01]|uniref:NAD(P)/FAD-dependent oxidoreductase n=1 Tax=Tissierella sp. Yu-01 TaxID=3035694 RepID=UPI00240E5D7C|nr:FAD-dependent oxidoreductase [Tissierella sp. Yu-01]WFA09457.1 FAD-dependent oxidoreductase [Tissierella sp. Yu-01]
MSLRYLIIGNGIAGLAAAKEIRRNDKEGSILLVSKEPYLTYWRIKLTEAIAMDLNKSDFLVNKETWYNENNIEVLLNREVSKIVPESNKVILDDNTIINYEKLLLATGSTPFIPPVKGIDKEGVFSLRTLDDLEELKTYIKDCGTVSVIGGGLLGIEAAWALSRLGKKVNVIEYSPHLLSRQLDKEIGDKLAERLISEGLNIFLPESSEEIIGDKYVTGLKVSQGHLINTDAILFSTGVRPNIDLVKDTDIQYNRGIKVDRNMKTNIDNIFAAGDVVEINSMVIGLWTVSNDQGKIAGANMSGNKVEFDDPKLFTNLKIKDIQVFSAGNIQDYDRIYEYKDEEKDIHHKLYTKNNKINAVILYGDLTEVNKLRSAVINHQNIEEYLSDGLPFK